MHNCTATAQQNSSTGQNLALFSQQARIVYIIEDDFYCFVCKPRFRRCLCINTFVYHSLHHNQRHSVVRPHQIHNQAKGREGREKAILRPSVVILGSSDRLIPCLSQKLEEPLWTR